MLSFDKPSPEHLAQGIASRVRELRLVRGWSRAELGARAGVAVPTLRRFEDTGMISLERLLKLGAALEFLTDFDRLAAPSEPTRSLADLDAIQSARRRQRGRTGGRDARGDAP